MTRKCIKKKCTCKFDLAKIARKDLPWAQLMGSQDITLMPSSTAHEEGGCNCNSLVLMNLGDKFGKEILEAKQIATASNSPHGVLTLDISLGTIQALVRFASEGRINLQNLSEQTREEIWQFSISFSVPGLLKLCGQFLLENLSASNATRSYKTTIRYLCMDYQAPVRKFILHNFNQVALEDPQFTSLVEYFEDILPDDDLNVREEQLFLILQKLSEENPEMLNQLAELTKFIRYLLIDPKVIEEEIAGESLSSNATVQKNGMKLASDFFKTRDSKPTKKTPPKKLVCKTRIPNEIVFTFGGQINGDPSKVIMAFDIRSKTWKQSRSKIPTKRVGHGLEAIDDNVYLFGPYGQKWPNSTEVFSLKDGKWKPKCPMNNVRYLMSTAVHQNRIYAIGGCDGEQNLNSLECLDPKENTWTLLPPMTVARAGHTSVTYCNKLYIIGGFGSDDEVLSSVEVYDIEAQEWTWGPSINQPRSRCKAVVYRQKIFVLGGLDGDQRLRSVECLDMTQPRSVWSQAADMITPRDCFGVCVIDDRILVMGGFTGNGATNKAETYSGDKGVWTSVPDMPSRNAGLACVTMSELKNASTYSSQKTMGQ